MLWKYVDHWLPYAQQVRLSGETVCYCYLKGKINTGHLIVNVSKKMQTINKKLHCASAMRLGI